MIFQNELSKLTHDAVTSEFIIPNVGVTENDIDIAENFSTAELCFAMLQKSKKSSTSSATPSTKNKVENELSDVGFAMKKIHCGCCPKSYTESDTEFVTEFVMEFKKFRIPENQVKDVCDRLPLKLNFDEIPPEALERIKG
eukprot:GHVP01049152.1.p1 GENE.GHVP01049152.1~~GHVP01049152.1.p1  ORF type:complete len:141 (+),score=26.56 GHVP01049152.1:51-473(+)